MENYTVTALKADKAELENTIKATIEDFQKRTGFVPNEIDYKNHTEESYDGTILFSETIITVRIGI